MIFSKQNLGFYADDYPEDRLPADGKPISDELYHQLLEGQAQGKVIDADDAGQPFLRDRAPLSIPQLKSNKLQEINSACDREIAKIKAGYPDSEVLSWARQEVEAKAFLNDSSANTVLLAQIATHRGIEIGDLANRIVAKAEGFAAATGEYIGKRQALEDQLDAVSDIDNPENRAAIAAIIWQDEVLP